MFGISSPSPLQLLGVGDKLFRKYLLALHSSNISTEGFFFVRAAFGSSLSSCPMTPGFVTFIVVTLKACFEILHGTNVQSKLVTLP